MIFCEVRPGANVVAEDDIKSFIRQVAGTVYHPCGTCKMGQDDKAVVDPELRVRGIDGLRVAFLTPVSPPHMDPEGVTGRLIGSTRHVVGVVDGANPLVHLSRLHHHGEENDRGTRPEAGGPNELRGESNRLCVIRHQGL